MIKGASFVDEKFDEFTNKNKVLEKTKEMLNYIKKENILLNSDLIIEKVN